MKINVFIQIFVISNCGGGAVSAVSCTVAITLWPCILITGLGIVWYTYHHRYIRNETVHCGRSSENNLILHWNRHLKFGRSLKNEQYFHSVRCNLYAYHTQISMVQYIITSVASFNCIRIYSLLYFSSNNFFSAYLLFCYFLPEILYLVYSL